MGLHLSGEVAGKYFMDGVWQWFGDTRGTRKSPCSQGAHAGGVEEEVKQTDIYKPRRERERERTGEAREGFTEEVMTELSCEEGF